MKTPTANLVRKTIRTLEQAAKISQSAQLPNLAKEMRRLATEWEMHLRTVDAPVGRPRDAAGRFA